MKRTARSLSTLAIIATLLFASCTPNILRDDSYSTGASDTPSVLMIHMPNIPGDYSIDGSKVVFEEGFHAFTKTWDDTDTHQMTIEFTPDDPTKKIGFTIQEGNIYSVDATIKKNPITVAIRQSTLKVTAIIID